ncbi:cellulose synthase subunit BcsC-related outer membrane protein [Paraburkholderia phymatum]|uniref:Cellulose synthase operon C domain protein n=1 Tax=Paraburkholderia phymatum (strain DSM 17167 / CIP 108236 / LMG 21445 / STM815) TaxID=391038 RepID=B2JS34_PARP8|nr:cellulose synthase subunit BcsC-related outer membrane protein [Paraburkholderia phymatum]ACC72411.1 cellulose synthase operon C domain protein [Paraburkholderia phymatum STM815]
MPIRQRALVIGIALTLGAGAAASAFAQGQPNDPMNVLIDQGKYWQAHQRGDLAEQAWLKVLRIDPKQPDALYGMGIVMSDRKDGAGAQQYLARLRQAAPNYPNMDELARRLGQSSPTDQAVNDARRLAQSGQQASAAQAYRQALGTKPANPQLALEYYQALGSSPQGWEEARRGLEQLAREHRDDPRFALAYARHLTYREANRREGIEQLAQLSKDSIVGAQAKAAWRQALLWLGVRASDAPLFQAYLSVAPDDAAVKARADSISEQDRRASERAQQNAGADARGRTVAEGFAALDRGDLVTAKARFSSVLASSPNDGDALGGMGVALLKQEQFAQAREYLLRASQQGGAARWREALNSATYWMYTSEGLGEQSNGNLAHAKALFEKAIAVSPGDVTAQTALGDLLMQSGDPRGAEAAFRMALRRQADNPDAIRGLVGALAAQGRGDDALSFANQLTEAQRKKVGGADRLRGEAQAAQARAAEARGDLGNARSLFEDALLSNPDDPWLRLDLARIYAKQGAYANAKSIMDGLIALHPDMPDAFYASALLAADMQDWRYGLSQLERIPVNKRTDAMALLQHRLWVHQQCDEAVALAKSGRVAQARGVLNNAEPVAGNHAELIGAIASAYVNTGDTARALMMVRGAVARSPNDAGLLLTDAGILLNAGQDAELGEVMRRLASMQLTGQQRSDFEKINVAIVVRRTDALRQANDLASAFDVLSPWLAARPNDPDILAALARLYTANNDNANALATYRLALAQNPNDLGLLLNAAGAATQIRKFDFAESSLRHALRIAPNNADALAAMGRMYRAQGRNSLAAQYFQRALIAQNAPLARQGTQPAGVNGTPVPSGWDVPLPPRGPIPLPGTNPFANRTSADASNSVPFPAQNTQPYLMPMPAYTPPTQPAPYIAPQTQPASQIDSLGVLAPQAASNGREAPDVDGYGPDQYGSSQSGGGLAPGQAYPGQGYAQPQSYQQPYPQQAYQQPVYVQPNDAAVSTPWPMSPQAQAAAQAQATQGMNQQPTSASKKRAAKNARATNSSAASAQQQGYAQPYPQQQAYPPPYPQQPAYAQQPYPQQRAYAQQAYPQQGYQPQPYQQQAYPQQAYPQNYTNQGYGLVPYIPQPPAPYPARNAQLQDEQNRQYRQPAQPQPLTVEEELAQINREQTSTVSGGIVFRNRDGENGLSNLTDIEAPVQGRIRAGDGHVIVEVTPVTLDAGTASNNTNTLARFGSSQAFGTSTVLPGSQTASGVGADVGYEWRGLKADVGATPWGFREQNIVGGVQYRGNITDKVSYKLTAGRRGVTDSLLSYAGAHDSAMNLQWGGVTSNGLRGDAGWDDGTNGLYVNASWAYLMGHNVASNNAVKGGGGVYTRLVKDTDQTLTVGVNTTLMHYDKNLSYFTFGQGGYFSPQQYAILNLPIEYTGRNGPFTYDLKASIGVQHYRQDESDYFPTNSTYQSKAASASNVPDPGAVYPSQSKTGVSYSIDAVGEYQLAPQLAVGAAASFGNAYQYREFVAAVYVRYAFTKQSGSSTFPPSPVRSYYLPVNE